MIGVTLFCVLVGWLGPEVRLVQKRKAWYAVHTLGLSWDPNFMGVFQHRGPPPNLIRRWLGDEVPNHIIALRPNFTVDEYREAFALFPDADIIQSCPPPSQPLTLQSVLNVVQYALPAPSTNTTRPPAQP